MIRDLYSSRFCAIAIIAAVFSVAVSIAPLALTSCDSRFTRADGGGTPPVLNDGAKGGQEWRGKPFDLSAVKAELENSPVPENADETVWDALGKAFIIELERAQSNRAANAAPKQDAGRVDDFKFDSATGLVSWTYKNLGDYDLSGEVGIADITAIALNFGKTIEYDGEGKPTGDIETPEGLENHRLAWIDGDKNGEIGISDVTPIALNYLNDVVEYAVVSADSATAPDGEWIELFRIIMPTDKTFPVRFEQMLPGGARNLVGVRAVGKAGDLGERSNLAAVITTVAPVIYAINVPSGVSGDVVLFSAVVTGTHPRFYEWNFGGGAEPNVTNDPLPTVTLGAIGWYDGRLTVTNEYGTAIRDFRFYIPGKPLQPPVAIAQAWPLGGDAPLEVTFLSKNSYSPNGAIVKYEWDFETDGTYDWESDVPTNATHTYEGGLWKATLRVTDEAGVVGTAETALVTAYPVEGWTITGVDQTALFDETSNVFIDFFYYPDSVPSMVTMISLGRVSVFFPSHSFAWQRSHSTESSIGIAFGSLDAKLAGVRQNGDVVLFSRPTSPTRVVLIHPNGAFVQISPPAVPFMSNTRFGNLKLNGEFGLIGAVYASHELTGESFAYLAEYEDSIWNFEQIPLPNINIADMYFDGDSLAFVTSGDSLWLAIKEGDGWRTELIDVPPALTAFKEVRIHKIGGKFSAVASFTDEFEQAGGIRFVAERDGFWESEDIVPMGDPAGFSKVFSSAAGNTFLSVAFFSKQNRILRVLLYDGADWSNEALSFSRVVEVGGLENGRKYSIGSGITETGTLHIVFRAHLEGGSVNYYYASRQLD